MSTKRAKWCVLAAALGTCLVIPIACKGLPDPSYLRPPVTIDGDAARTSWANALGVFESRCVVCHACYDAPCQLKLGTFEGVSRGATTAKVYDGMRLDAATPTRLGIDAHTTAAWRMLEFHPTLPEGAETDPRLSLLVRMLALKRAHPLPAASAIARDFTFDLDREETCTDAAHFPEYAAEHPLWGMPYALPGLSPQEEAMLTDWVAAGAPSPEPAALAPSSAAAIATWEAFLNSPDLKSRLASRYIYEHLFLASIFFSDLGTPRTYFRLVRSRTPAGAVDEIATRRPYDDPGVARVFYRLVPRVEGPIEKTHMPYPLSARRLRRFRDLFIDLPYQVVELPGYEAEVAANPFRAFRAIPARSRYRFMLEEAEFTLMGFIKGPVCRGQVALDVIEDRFWVTFLNPDLPWMDAETTFLANTADDLATPAERGSSIGAIWSGYGRRHTRYVEKKNAFVTEWAAREGGVTMAMIWDGDGANSNAALTVLRHFDSATVVKGLVGGPPKTAWVIGYPLLERVHYLLVAGFDVFGSVGHQLTTRLYMDFLRMEGEASFLMFLPPARRAELARHWYRDVDRVAQEKVNFQLDMSRSRPRIAYRDAAPEGELFALMAERVRGALDRELDVARIEDTALRASLVRLDRVRGSAASWLPELSFVALRGDAAMPRATFTMARDSGHSNVAYLFGEASRRLPAEDEITVVPGLLGAYPNALFEVDPGDLDAFVDTVAGLDGAAAYRSLRTRFGVLRTSDRFWALSDALQLLHVTAHPTSGGRFDYSRLEAY